MLLDTFGERRAGEACDAQPRIVEPRTAGLFRQRDPHLGGRLRGQLVEAQRGEEAEHTIRHALGDVRERVRLARSVIGGSVDAARLPDHASFLYETRKIRTRDAVIFELSRAYEPALLDQGKGPVLGGRHAMDDTKRR